MGLDDFDTTDTAIGEDMSVKIDVDGNDLKLNNNGKQRSTKASRKKISCKNCMKPFSSTTERSVHAKLCVETFPCGQCDFVTKNRFYIKKHILRMHKTTDVYQIGSADVGNEYELEDLNNASIKALELIHVDEPDIQEKVPEQSLNKQTLDTQTLDSTNAREFKC